MVDKTTEGVFAEPEEVEAVLHNLCGYHLSERDPVFRYTVLTREQVLYDGLVAAIKRERGRALAELVSTGQSLTQVAAMTNLRTRQRVQRLIAIAKAADEAVAQVQAASREFEEKLAAVEATLDEVLNGAVPAGAALADDPAGVVAERLAAGEYDERADIDEYDERVDILEPREPVKDGRSLDVTVVLEPTQAMPALGAALNPTRELPEEDAKWWRRGRDTGAA
jgi:hypothetical protein